MSGRMGRIGGRTSGRYGGIGGRWMMGGPGGTNGGLIPWWCEAGGGLKSGLRGGIGGSGFQTMEGQDRPMWIEIENSERG